jgi:hypothetical protein
MEQRPSIFNVTFVVLSSPSIAEGDTEPFRTPCVSSDSRKNFIVISKNESELKQALMTLGT